MVTINLNPGVIMASQLRAASQRSSASGAFGGFPTPSQYIEDTDSTIPVPSQPHHEVVSASQLPDLDDIPQFSFSPLSETTNSNVSSQDDSETLSQKEQRLAKVRFQRESPQFSK